MRSLRSVPFLLALAGIGGTALLWWSLRSREHDTAQAIAELEAADEISSVERQLASDLEQVRSTVALFHSSNEVTALEFTTFTRQCIDRHPPLRALFWVETGADSGRVRYAEGPEGPSFGGGGDRAFHAELARTLERARSIMDLAVSAPFPADDQPGLRVVAALGVQRENRIAGFVCGLLDVEHSVAVAHRERAECGHVVFVQDVLAPDAPLLAGLPGRGTLVNSKETDLGLEPPGTHLWRIGCEAPQGLVLASGGWKSWSALALGLVATGLLVSTWTVTSGRARVRRMVEVRTHEVRQAYATLAREAKERLSAVAEAQLLQQRMRQIIDLLPDMIYVKDWFGRYLLANEATARARGTTVQDLTLRPLTASAVARAAADPELEEERGLMEEQRSSIVATQPFVDERGRSRILRAVRIPCPVFGTDTRALLCVASDITEQKRIEDILRGQNLVLREVASGADPQRVLELTAEVAQSIAVGMRCSVLVLSPDGRRLTHRFARSLPASYVRAIDGLEIGPTVGSCGAAAFLGKRVIVQDVRTHPNWVPFRELAEKAGIRACWSQPIRAANGSIAGTLAMYYSEPRGPQPFEEELIETMAYLAGIALALGPPSVLAKRAD